MDDRDVRITNLELHSIPLHNDIMTNLELQYPYIMMIEMLE